ncbi:MAG TPA: nucleic acid-binding protein, partial [bacterium]|nr:nucleic acid-binding protein [bacterium]
AKGGERMRELAVEAIKHLQENPNVEIVPQTSLQFQSAVQRYASRLDKGWSVTDCASFLIMEQKGVCDALTSDHHFAQASFNLLMK